MISDMLLAYMLRNYRIGALLSTLVSSLNIGAFFSLSSMNQVDDALFSAVESFQRETGKPWGRFLDSGTGSHSLKWIRGLDTDGWTAVTADAKFSENMQKSLNITELERSQIVIGNWDDPLFLEGEMYDTILADYLIGAIDGFSPYFQDQIIERLKKHLNDNGTLYIIGMQPVPDVRTGSGSVVSEVVRLRDACILLAGHRPYREYPVDWVERQLRSNGFDVKLLKRMPILHSEESIKRQISVASSKLPYFRNSDLADSFKRHIHDVTARVSQACNGEQNKRIQLGFDYIIAAEKSGNPSI